MAHRSIFLLICLLATPAIILAQDGAALYRRHCATCHEAGAQTRAPSREALRQLTPERIVYALESIASPMSNVGLGRTREERRAIAAYLSVLRSLRQ
jgi:polyvinyl alcohol dehydrogenase (cytochrome)